MDIDLSHNATWRKFINYAFKISDMFSLTNYCWSSDCSLNYNYYQLTERLQKYEENVFSKKLPHGIWGEYSISYFECNFFTMSLILEISNICEMKFPSFPEDICFYIEDKMWFESTTHDEIWRLTDPTQNIEDIF